MKRFFFLSFVAIVVTSICFAQDIIVQKDRSTIQAKVSEIGTSEVKYKKWSNQDGPLYAISKKDLYAIIYHDGKLDELCENIPESFKTWLSAAAGEIEAKYRDELDEQAYREAMRELESTSQQTREKRIIDEQAYREAMRELENTSQQTREERIKKQSSISNADKPFDPNEIINCFNCGGSGLIPFGFTMQKCHFCLGSGKQTAGKYMRNVTLPENGGYNGGNVGGSSSSNSHIRNTEQEKRDVLNRTYGEKCLACGGSGKCHACNGTKVAHSFGNTYECTVCRNGICGVCNGTGKTSWNR